MAKHDHAQQVVRALADKLRQWETSNRSGRAAVVSSGIAELDALLPDGGFCRGTLVEWTDPGPGSGAVTLALLTAQQACADGGPLIVVDRSGEFYPPALPVLAEDQLYVVRPANDRDEIWALEQILRCTGVGAVLAELGDVADRDYRRLQLAAEAGEGLGLFRRTLRQAAARHAPCWAETRLAVTPIPLWNSSGRGRLLRIAVLRCRTQATDKTVALEMDDETGHVRVVSSLADSAPRWRKTGA